MSLLDLVFPPRCAACGTLLPEPAPLCEACRVAVIDVPEPTCRVCGLPVEELVKKCERCRIDPPPFARAVAAFSFEGSIAAAIPRFKYDERPQLAEALVELAWPVLRSQCEAVELLAPIPLHRARLRERGYDQALLLADALGERAKRSVVAELLERTRPTAPQVGTDAVARMDNLRGAFQASPAARGKRIVLVDDVITTTATARDAARALIEAGAAEVRVVAIARAL